MPPYLSSPEDFAEFLSRFESGQIPRAEWNHAAHLAGLAAVAHSGPPETAFDRVKSAILRYAASQGIESTPTSGYHETITRFWVERITELTAGLGRGGRPYDAARAAVAAFAHRGRLFDLYYTFDIVNSTEARTSYIVPDRPIS